MENDLINRQAAINAVENTDCELPPYAWDELTDAIMSAPSAQPEIIRCRDCKHNPKYDWFGCPMSHLNEKQRPETAWCWKGERRTDE